MGLENELNEAQQELHELRVTLGHVNAARARRRANELRHEREGTEAHIEVVIEHQDETEDHIERLEDRLEKWPPDSQPAAALVIEIDHLERELHRRHMKLEKLRDRDQRQTHNYRRLDAKADRREKRQAKLEQRKRELLRRIENLNDALNEQEANQWPADVAVQELLYHAPPHCHFASYEREKLVQIGRIAASRGLRVGEFPPFDSVECVHTSSSFHYRTSGGAVLSCSSSALDFGGSAGCAMDVNDLDGGSDQELAFYHELETRYG